MKLTIMVTLDISTQSVTSTECTVFELCRKLLPLRLHQYEHAYPRNIHALCIADSRKCMNHRCSLPFYRWTLTMNTAEKGKRTIFGRFALHLRQMSVRHKWLDFNFDGSRSTNSNEIRTQPPTWNKNTRKWVTAVDNDVVFVVGGGGFHVVVVVDCRHIT